MHGKHGLKVTVYVSPRAAGPRLAMHVEGLTALQYYRTLAEVRAALEGVRAGILAAGYGGSKVQYRAIEDGAESNVSETAFNALARYWQEV